MSQGPQIWGKMFLFLAAGPSQRSPPFPHVQTESNCSCHWFKLERMGVCCVGEGGPQVPWGQSSRLLALGKGEGAPCSLPVSSGQAPARYCLKPHSPMPMGQGGGGGRRRAGEGSRVVIRSQGESRGVYMSQKPGV